MVESSIVTIDGPSGAGKSTISQRLAVELGYTYLDTGAMYRAVALKAVRREVTPQRSGRALESLLADLDLELRTSSGETLVFLDGEDVSGLIRTPDMALQASRFSALSAVRQRLTELQRRIGRQGLVVAEGRDMGTVVFPEARYKFFLEATPVERARRRVLQLKKMGQQVEEEEILQQIIERDRADSSRELAPLKPAENALIVDSSQMSIEQVVAFMMEWIRKRCS